MLLNCGTQSFHEILIVGPEPYPTAFLKAHKPEVAMELNPGQNSSDPKTNGTVNGTVANDVRILYDYVSTV